MPRPLVLDSSALILASRRSADRLWIERIVRSRRGRLPAVVIGELYAGTRSNEEATALARFFGFFVRNGLVLVPDVAAWELAGRLVARRARLAVAVQARDHLNDVLIAIGAARVGGSVLTANVRHFEVWTELLRAGGQDVTVTPFVPPSSR